MGGNALSRDQEQNQSTNEQFSSPHKDLSATLGGGGLAMEPRILQKRSSFLSSNSEDGGIIYRNDSGKQVRSANINYYSKNKGSGIQQPLIKRSHEKVVSGFNESIDLQNKFNSSHEQINKSTMNNNNLSPHTVQESKTSPLPIWAKPPHMYQQNGNLSSARYFLIKDGGEEGGSPPSPSNFQSNQNMMSPATVELPSSYVLGSKKPPEPLIMLAKGQMTMSRRQLEISEAEVIHKARMKQRLDKKVTLCRVPIKYPVVMNNQRLIANNPLVLDEDIYNNSGMSSRNQLMVKHQNSLQTHHPVISSSLNFESKGSSRHGQSLNDQFTYDFNATLKRKGGFTKQHAGKILISPKTKQFSQKDNSQLDLQKFGSSLNDSYQNIKNSKRQIASNSSFQRNTVKHGSASSFLQETSQTHQILADKKRRAQQMLSGLCSNNSIDATHKFSNTLNHSQAAQLAYVSPKSDFNSRFLKPQSQQQFQRAQSFERIQQIPFYQQKSYEQPMPHLSASTAATYSKNQSEKIQQPKQEHPIDLTRTVAYTDIINNLTQRLYPRRSMPKQVMNLQQKHQYQMIQQHVQQVVVGKKQQRAVAMFVNPQHQCSHQTVAGTPVHEKIQSQEVVRPVKHKFVYDDFQVDNKVIDFNENTEPNFKEMSLPSAAIMMLIMFNIEDYPKMLRLSSGWNFCIQESIDEYCGRHQLEQQFIQSYGKYLSFIRASNQATPLRFCGQRGLRLDRVFQCEVLGHKQSIDLTMKIAYDFKYHERNNEDTTSVMKSIMSLKSAKTTQRSQTSQQFISEYKFDILKNRTTQRVTWAHLSGPGPFYSDEAGQTSLYLQSEMQDFEAISMPPYTQNEIQVAPGDIIQFSVSLANMNGVVDLSTLQWRNPSFMEYPVYDRDCLTYNREAKIAQNQGDRRLKVHCNTNRICEIEDAAVEWIPVSLEDVPKIPIYIGNYLLPKQQLLFKVVSTSFNELDQHFNKIVLQTQKRGSVIFQQHHYKLTVDILDTNQPILNEIKRRGVMFDRNKPQGERIQVRIGDILVLYNTRSLPSDFQPDIIYAMSDYASKTSGQGPPLPSLNQETHN